MPDIMPDVKQLAAALKRKKRADYMREYRQRIAAAAQASGQKPRLFQVVTWPTPHELITLYGMETLCAHEHPMQSATLT